MNGESMRSWVRDRLERGLPDAQKFVASLEEYWDFFFARKTWRLFLYNNLFYHMEEVTIKGEKAWIFTDATWHYLEDQIEDLLRYKAQIQRFHWKKFGRVLYRMNRYKGIAQDVVAENQMLWDIISNLVDEMQETAGKQAMQPDSKLQQTKDKRKEKEKIYKKERIERLQTYRENLQPEDILKGIL